MKGFCVFANNNIGPYASFLPSMPDWINMTQDEYNKSSEALPLPAVGPVPPDISLERALKVSYHMLMHQYNFIRSDIGSDPISRVRYRTRHGTRYRIRYVTYVYNQEGSVPNPRAKTNHTDRIRLK